MSPTRRRWLLALALAGWTLLIWHLLVSGRPPSLGWMPWRRFAVNMAHAPLFGLQAALMAALWRKGPLGGVLPAAILALAYGAFIEWHQGAVPGRVASALDVLTDAVGALGLPWALVPGARWLARGLPVALLAALAAGIATSASA